MPTRERVKDLIAMVEQGRYVEALQRFYHKNATMQENLQPVRQGLPTLIAGEEKVLSSFKEVRTMPVKQQYMLEGDRSVINWVFIFTAHDGRSFRQDELSWQRWDGDRIIEERFYYDPAQQALTERRKSPRTAAAGRPAR
jgi:ketosteroid isomerase-like protein